MALSHALEITAANFDEVTDTELPVLLDFEAGWCPHCQALRHLIDELAGLYAGRAIVGRINTDLNPALAAQYQIRTLPTLLVLLGGEVVARHTGTAGKNTLQALLEKALF